MVAANPTAFARRRSGPARPAGVGALARARRAVRPGGRPGAAGPGDGAARAGRCRRRSPALIARRRREVRARASAPSAGRPAAGRARVVVSAVAVDRAGHLGGGRGLPSGVPFTGSFLLIALLVVGVAVPTPGAVGGFHEAFRLGATMFFGAPDDAAVGAAIVLHVVLDRAGAAARAGLRGAGRAESLAACGGWPTQARAEQHGVTP